MEEIVKDLMEDLELIVNGWEQVEKNVRGLTPWETERKHFAEKAIARAKQALRIS